jgi:hypothetical protein
MRHFGCMLSLLSSKMKMAGKRLWCGFPVCSYRGRVLGGAPLRPTGAGGCVSWRTPATNPRRLRFLITRATPTEVCPIRRPCRYSRPLRVRQPATGRELEI